MVVRDNNDSLRGARFVSLSLGASALIGLSVYLSGDWFYDEWGLPAVRGLMIVAAALAWLAALVLTVGHRTPRAVVALAACPTLLLAVWLAFLD